MNPVGLNHVVWNAKYELLVKFVQKHEHSPCAKDDAILSVWVYNQKWRRDNSDDNDNLSKAKQAKLEKIPGWNWNESQQEKNWKSRYQILREFVRIHKRFPFPEEGRIYTWVYTQRRTRVKGTISPDHVKKLEKITGWEWAIKPRRPLHPVKCQQPDTEKRKQIAKLKQGGWSVQKIATHFSCSRQNVYRLLEGSGVRPYSQT